MHALVKVSMIGASTVALLIATAAAAAPERDLKRLQGKWRLVAVEIDGSRTAVPPASEAVIEGNRCTTTTGGQVEVSTIAIRSDTQPKQLDATDSQGRKTEMIYRLDKDKWIVCATFAGTNAPRPKRFQADKSSQQIVLVYRSVPR